MLNVNEDNLAVLGRAHNVITTRQYLQGDYIVNHFTAFDGIANLAPSKCPSFLIDFEEPNEAVSEGSDHVRFELMHGDGTALLLGHDELQDEFAVIHVPALDHPVGTRGGNQVVLVELM